MKNNLKKTRSRMKIIGATATAVFSLASVFAGTYAWFASNTSATATGMQVSVKSSGGCTLKSIRLVKFDYEKIKLSETISIDDYLNPGKGKVSSYIFNENENNTFGYYDENDEWVPINAMNAYDPYEKVIKGNGFSLYSMNSNVVYEMTFSNPSVDSILTLHSELKGMTADENDRELLLSSCADFDVFYKDDLKIIENTFVGSNITSFDSSNNYSSGTYVTYNGSIYKCIADFTSDETNPSEDETHWSGIAFSDESSYSLGDYVLFNTITYQCVKDISSPNDTPDNDTEHWAAISYSSGDIILNNDRLYKCKNNVSSSWVINSTNWEEINDYDSAYGYQLNDIVTYEGKLYKNTTAIGEAWDSNHWKSVSVFSSSTSYGVGDYTIDNNQYYKCVSSIEASQENENETLPRSDNDHWSSIAYKTGSNYKIGDYVTYSNTLYRFIQDVTNAASTPDGTKWETVGNYSNTETHAIGDLIYYNSALYLCTFGNKREFDDSKWTLLTTYSDSQSYSLNSIVSYNGELYRRNNATTAVDGAFNHTKWQQLLYKGYYYPSYKTFDSLNPASADEDLYYGVSYLAINKTHKNFYSQSEDTINLNNNSSVFVPKSNEDFVVYINVNYNPNQLKDYYLKINTTEERYTAINDFSFDFVFSSVS